jgi:hypothetical protein
MNDFKQAQEVLRAHNTWRRGCDVTPPTDPKELGAAIDTAIVALQITDALMGEPSNTVCIKANITPRQFSWMRDELLKGIL